MSVQGINPKDALAVREDKAPLNFLEPAGNEGIARALKFGGDKYGPRNYLQTPVLLSVYIAAMERHIDALKEGEDFAPDSGCHHTDHVGANVHIIKAALKHGTLVDDRVLPPKPEPEPEPEQPCPNRAMENGGVCDCAGQFTGGYEACLDDCRRNGVIQPHPDSWEGSRGE